MFGQWRLYYIEWEAVERDFKGVAIYYDGAFRDINSDDTWQPEELKTITLL